jgi:hypothetical protein
MASTDRYTSGSISKSTLVSVAVPELASVVGFWRICAPSLPRRVRIVMSSVYRVEGRHVRKDDNLRAHVRSVQEIGFETANVMSISPEHVGRQQIRS